MKYLGVWLQLVSRWLVAWLISTWGAAMVMIGTPALAVSAAAYLASAADHQAPVVGSMPVAITPVPIQSLCKPMVVGGALALPPQCNTTVPVPCARSVPVVAYMPAAAGRDPWSCALDLQ